MEQRAEFQQLLTTYIDQLHESKKPSNPHSVNQEKYNRILTALQLLKGAKCSEGAHFKFWCMKHFKCVKIGRNNVLYCKKTSHPIVTEEETVPCHERVGHAGRSKTHEIQSSYALVRHDVVQLFLKTCKACNVRPTVKNPPAGRPMISLSLQQWVAIYC